MCRVFPKYVLYSTEIAAYVTVMDRDDGAATAMTTTATGMVDGATAMEDSAAMATDSVTAMEGNNNDGVGRRNSNGPSDGNGDGRLRPARHIRH